MEFQTFVDTFTVPASVLSVEKTPEGICGAINIICANQSYKQTMGPSYYDGMPYEQLVPKDIKFENYCFQAAHQNKRMHAYVETRALNCWTDQQMIPLVKETDRVGYCLFLFEFTKEGEAGRMAELNVDSAALVIKCCIALTRSESFEENLNNVAEEIRDSASAASCRIIMIDDEHKKIDVLAENTVGNDLRHDAEHDGTIPYEVVKSWEAMIGVSNDVIVTNDHEMDLLEKRNPEWVRSMREYYVKTLVLIPLRQAKQIIGYLYAVNFDVERVVSIKELFELMSYFIGSELYNYYLMRKLERMSYHDGLTDLHNRLAMGETVTKLERTKQPYGIIDIDVNFLKKINDQQGHQAGDRYLIHAVELMKQMVPEKYLYRTGGDEFLAIIPDITKEEFDALLDKFQKTQEDDEFDIISAGASWNDGTSSFTETYQKADEAMYIEKRKYHQKHNRAA